VLKAGLLSRESGLEKRGFWDLRMIILDISMKKGGSEREKLERRILDIWKFWE